MKLQLLDRLKLVEESTTFEPFLARVVLPYYMKVPPIKREVDNMGFNIKFNISQRNPPRWLDCYSRSIYTYVSVAPKIPCKSTQELHVAENRLLRLIGDDASVHYFREDDPITYSPGFVEVDGPISRKRDIEKYHSLRFVLFPSIPPEGQKEKGKFYRFWHKFGEKDFSKWYNWKEKY